MKRTASIVFIGLMLYIGLVVYTVHNYNHGNCVNCGQTYVTDTFIIDGTSYTYFTCPNCGYEGFIKDVNKLY